MGNRGTLLVFMVLVAELCGKGLSHKCIHDKIARRYSKTFIPHLGETSDGARERRQANTYSSFRMEVYFVMENISNPSTILPLLNDQAGGFQLSVTYLQSVLSVIRAPNNLIVPPRCTFRRNGQCVDAVRPMCGPYATIPDEHLGTITVCDPTCRDFGGSNTGVDADYIFYISAVDDSDCSGGTQAYASACSYDDNNNRPLTGYTNICPQSLQSATTQSLFMLILHETLHALGFSSDDFEYFIDQNGNEYNGATTLRINGANVLAINSPKVLSYGREYYSCSSLQGVLLENEGGGGSSSSHWEARTISYEVMIAASSEFEADYTSISNFTLNLLEDSGWYKVNYAVAESIYNYELLWGRGLGCSFITANCNNWPYSCPAPSGNTDLVGCSYDYQALAYCDDTDFYDNCYFFNPYSNGFCNEPGAPITGSCFPLMTSSGSEGRCYDRQCYRHSSTQQLFYTVTRSGTTQLCPYDGATLTFSGGVLLTCPQADLTCSRNTAISLFDATGDIPPSWCHSTCATCSRPASPAHCLTCSASDGLFLRGEAPSVCNSDSCAGDEYLDSSGNCIACATGCRACTGPRKSECLACVDETLYRVTSDRLTGMACVAAADCGNAMISAFGDRTCGSAMNTNRGGGVNSVHSITSQFVVLVLIAVYSLHL